MHAQLPGRVEQQNERTPPDQAALAQFMTGQAAQQAIIAIDPGNLFDIRGRTVRSLQS